MTPICDFCSQTPVIARYRADDLIAAIVVDDIILYQHSVGDWAACLICSALLDGKHWDMLLDRAVATFYVAHPEMEELPEGMVREYLRNLYRELQTRNFKRVPL